MRRYILFTFLLMVLLTFLFFSKENGYRKDINEYLNGQDVVEVHTLTVDDLILYTYIEQKSNILNLIILEKQNFNLANSYKVFLQSGPGNTANVTAFNFEYKNHKYEIIYGKGSMLFQNKYYLVFNNRTIEKFVDDDFFLNIYNHSDYKGLIDIEFELAPSE